MAKKIFKLQTGRTYTIGDDSPAVSIALGRLTPVEFAKAQRREGWSPSDKPHRDELRFEFWRVSAHGHWRPSGITDLKAVLVTVMDW
jgi:hypothetical protein